MEMGRETGEIDYNRVTTRAFVSNRVKRKQEDSVIFDTNVHKRGLQQFVLESALGTGALSGKVGEPLHVLFPLPAVDGHLVNARCEIAPRQNATTR